jgi:hypothetical protein
MEAHQITHHMETLQTILEIGMLAYLATLTLILWE